LSDHRRNLHAIARPHRSDHGIALFGGVLGAGWFLIWTLDDVGHWISWLAGGGALGVAASLIHQAPRDRTADPAWSRSMTTPVPVRLVGFSAEAHVMLALARTDGQPWHRDGEGPQPLLLVGAKFKDLPDLVAGDELALFGEVTPSGPIFLADATQRGWAWSPKLEADETPDPI
jgi:hypothetical protein